MDGKVYLLVEQLSSKDSCQSVGIIGQDVADVDETLMVGGRMLRHELADLVLQFSNGGFDGYGAEVEGVGDVKGRRQDAQVDHLRLGCVNLLLGTLVGHGGEWRMVGGGW